MRSAPAEADGFELGASGELEVRTRPIVRTGDLVTVRVLLVPMCTENTLRARRVPNQALGHEALGIVAETGPDSSMRIGQRVVVMPGFGCGECELCAAGEHIYCQHQLDLRELTNSELGLGTYAEFVVRPAHLLLPVPDDISDEHAALACCGLGPGLTAVRRSIMLPGDTVLVSGCGPVGLGAIVQAVALGARVVATSPNAFRAKLAESIGAETVIDPRASNAYAAISQATDGRGVDCVIETSGAASAQDLAFRSLRPLGVIATVAWGAGLTLPPPVPKGVTVHACWHWNHELYAKSMWATIRRSSAQLDTITTHILPFAMAAEAMTIQDAGECGKILLRLNS